MRPRTHRPASRSLHRPAPPLSGRRIERGSSRRPRRFASLDQRARRRGRRNASLALAGAWLAGLAALLAAPVFHVQRVDVSGNRRLTAAQVVAAAGLQRPGSVFQVDPGAIEQRLRTATWVRDARVSVHLPDRVGIRVDEWQPVAVYQAGSGRQWFLSDEALVLGQAGTLDAQPLLAIQGPARPEPRVGRAPLDRALLVALVNIQRALPGLIGQEVQSFTLDSCGELTLNARRGWKAQFGSVLTPEQRATLKDKVAALRALAVSGEVDFDRPGLGYVNLMNPAIAAIPGAGPPARTGRGAPSPSPPARSSPQPASPCA